jgi:outer membrane receptor for ferric coprogen and ferric-rhodotorulic acid
VSLGFDYQDNRPKGNTWGSFPMFLSNGQRTDWPVSVTTSTDWAFWNRARSRCSPSCSTTSTTAGHCAAH